LPGVRSAAMFRLRGPKILERFRRAPADAYEIRVFMAAAELTNLFEELRHIVALIPRALTFPELTAVIKLYIISWVSLSDVLAGLLNQVYDLGIAYEDVEFGALRRNRHIASTSVPAIVRTHEKALRYDEFAKLRNAIIHRGKLEEKELVTIHAEFLTAVLSRAVQLSTDDEAAKAAVTEAARQEANVQARVLELMKRKQVEYTEHLNATLEFLREVAPVLIERIEAQPT
jgi:hypothetical protein